MSHFPLDLMHVLASYSTEELWDLFQSVTGAQQSDQPCPICMLPVGTSSPGVFGFLANCVHVFCGHCILEWSRARFESGQTCPVCRTTFGTVILWPRLMSTYEREQLFRSQDKMLEHVHRDRVVEQQALRDQHAEMIQRQQNAIYIDELDRSGARAQEQLRQDLEKFYAVRAAEQAREHARREQEQAERIREQIRREYAQALSDADQARRNAERTLELVQRDLDYAQMLADRCDARRAREQAECIGEQARMQALANAHRAATFRDASFGYNMPYGPYHHHYRYY